MGPDDYILKHRATPGRRNCLRVETPEGVWVYWGCGRLSDTSRVRDLGIGGLFVETLKPIAVGTTTNLHFLVQEGQIRASAIVGHVEPGRGLGLKFTAMPDEDRLRLAELMKRHRSSS
jgi:hypothetical protein